MLIGKGMFLWQIKQVCGSDPWKTAGRAVELGLDSVQIKVADGAGRYNLRPPLWKDDLIGPLVENLWQVEIEPVGWQFVYGDNPAGEAKVAIERIKQFSFKHFIINAEERYKVVSSKAVSARRYMSEIRSACPDVKLYLCSYRYPAKHMELPWAEFLRLADGHVPQVYWVKANNPAWQVRESVRQLRALEKQLGLKELPIYPIGAAFKEHGWQPAVQELHDFHREVLLLARETSVTGFTWWEWAHAENLGFTRAIAQMDWPEDLPEEPGEEEPGLEEKVDRMWNYLHVEQGVV